MRKLTITQFVTLDGVAQSPGAPEEDPSGGFSKGGWLPPFAADPLFSEVVDARFEKAGAFLLGRTTYELMSAFWPNVSDEEPTAAKLNHLPKHVASTTLSSPEWENTTLIEGDVVEEVTRLKAEDGEGELQVHGSLGLAQTLMGHGLIDVYELLVFPVVLGEGKRLFGTGIDRSLRLVDHRAGESGLLALTYEPAGELAFGSVEGPS